MSNIITYRVDGLYNDIPFITNKNVQKFSRYIVGIYFEERYSEVVG